MDKNYKQKVKEFFRKEGFYVVLFLCLCIVTTVAAVSLKKARNAETQPNTDENQEISMNVDDKNVTNEMQNAERVENDNKNNEAQSNNNQDTTKQVSATNEVKFINPVQGNLFRGYKANALVKVSDDKLETYQGIDVTAKLGTEVKAPADGVIESVENSGVQYGMTVVINHANGIKTKYCNLEEDVAVKKGDKVTAGTTIGKVGETATLNKSYFGEHLNLQVFNANNEQVDPLKYFKYTEK